jgi:hypothetical protein
VERHARSLSIISRHRDVSELAKIITLKYVYIAIRIDCRSLSIPVKFPFDS